MDVFRSKFETYFKYKQKRTSMTLISDFDIIFKLFTFIGIPFCTFKVASTMKKICFMIIEVTFLAFAIYFGCVAVSRHKLNQYITFTVTSAAIHVTLIMLRILISLKRDKILQLVEELSYFSSTHDVQNSSQRWNILLFCSGCVLYAVFMHIISLVSMAMQKDNGIWLSSTYLLLFGLELDHTFFVSASIFSFIYTLIFHCTPLLIFILMGFLFKYLYISFDTCLIILSKYLDDPEVTYDDISRCIRILHAFTVLFSSSVKRKSFIVFLLYAYVFISQLNLITLFISLGGTINSKITISFIIVCILTTFLEISYITFAATSVQCYKTRLKDSIDNLYKNSVIRSQSVLYLVLLKYADNCDYSITAWGMFKLNKGLLITMYGVIVTYGYLLLQLTIAG